MARLRLTRVAVAAVAMFCSAAAVADPITIVAGLAPIIGGSAAAFIASHGLMIAVAGFGLHRTVQARRKQKAAAARARSDYNANLQDRNVTVISAEAPWQVVYGSPSPVGGAIVGLFTSGSRDEYKHVVVVFASHQCEAVDEIYIDGEPLGARDSSGWVTGGTFLEQFDVGTYSDVYFNDSGQATLAGEVLGLSLVHGLPLATSEYPGLTFNVNSVARTTDFSGGPVGGRLTLHYNVRQSYSRVNAQIHLSPGGADTADAYLMNAVPGQWAAADKLSGYTYAVITLDLNMARFQGGPPNVSAKLRGKKIHDFRTGTTYYHANPANCLADFLMSEAGFSCTQAQIESAAAIAAANACDAVGFSCDGAFFTSQDRESTKQQLEDCFGGGCFQSGGVWRIRAGSWTTPVMTIDEGDLAGPIEIQQMSHPSRERFNTCRGTYVDGAGLGVATDFAPWSNNAHLAADGFAKVKDVSFPFTKDHQRCQDLARMLVERSRGGMTIVLPCHMVAWPVQPGDRVAVNNAEFGFVNKTFLILDWTFHPRAPVGLIGVEDVAVYYDPAAVITVDAAPNSVLPNPFARPAAPQSFRVESGTEQLLVQADGTIVTRVLVQWAQADALISAAGEVHVRWSDALTGATQTVVVPGYETSCYLTGVRDGAMLFLAARFVRFVGNLKVVGNEAVTIHTVIGKTEPPSDVQTFTLDGDVLRWPAVDDLDLAGYQIRFAYGNNPFWNSAAPLHEGLVTSSPYTMAARPSGVMTLLIKAVDTSGNESLNAAVIVANLGDTEISNVLISYPEAPDFTGTITNGGVSGGVLQADATDLFYGDDAQPFYGVDTDDFYSAGTYAQLVYEWGRAPEAEGRVVLQHTIVASDYAIEFRRDSQDAFYGGDGDLFYGDDDDPFYGTPGDWSTWPGEITLRAPETITWRITTAGGPTQGQVSEATVVLDVPDVTEELNDVVIGSGGTRLPVTQSYRSIENLLLTVQTDGNGGVSARIEDKNAALGPLITVRNAAGTAVDGLVDARIRGY